MKQWIFNHRIICRVFLGLLFGLVVSLGISVSFAIDPDSFIFRLNGEEVVEVPVFGTYNEEGAKLYIGGEDLSSHIVITGNDIDTKKVGSYKVQYKYDLNKGSKNSKVITRVVKVVDNDKPTLVLNGSESITIGVGEEYKEAGYTVTDNYDSESKLKVTVNNKVNNKVVGDYAISYVVEDTSGNKTVVKRYVKVGNDKGVLTKNVNVSKYPNTVVSNKFTSLGIDIQGYLKNAKGKVFLKLIRDGSSETVVVSTSLVKKDYYQGEIRIQGLTNGTYTVYICDDREDRELLNKLGRGSRIVRSKIGNKLVTMDYKNDAVRFKVEDFKYEYDVFIDAGHGGSEIGAEFDGITEKELNLKLSRYEKCRFEEHDLKVLMTRDDDSDGLMIDKLGTKNKLTNRAYAIGYYGVVSRVAYSNHHNGSEDKSFSGYEILVQAGINDYALKDEVEIAHEFDKIYKLDENHLRFYARDYATNIPYEKGSGQRYDFNDYYVVLRVPYRLFNTKFVIFEGAYMSNSDDFKWYYKDANMVKVSEIKIERYVKSLGKVYNDDNSKCLQYLK